MNIWTLIKTVLGALPFIVLCLGNSKINLNKTNRAKQFAMPILTLAYCIAAVVLLDKVNALVVWLFDLLGRFLPFLKRISYESIMIYVLNCVFVVGFMAVKGILLPIISGIWGKSHKLMEKTSGFFYEYQEDLGKWTLQRQYGNFRGFYRGIYYAFFVLSMVVFVLSQVYPDASFFQSVFYPVFGILVMGEVVFYLDGMTKNEFVEDILGEDEESYKIANYGALRGVLRDLFEDRVLYENTLDTGDGLSTTFDALEDMMRSEDRQLKTMGTYFHDLKESGREIDINYVKSCLNLLNGRSTLFGNPFYRDLTDYIMIPVVKQLISYKKCLVVVGRDSAADDVQQWVSQSLADFANTGSLWRSKILDEGSTDAEIGIVKFSDIYNLKIQQANKDFLSRVGFVLLVEPSRILASGQIGLSLLVNQCEAEDKTIVYCACDRNCDGLVDALSHTLKTSITEVTATVSGQSNSSQMYWNADGSYLHHKILPNISRYLGVGTEINSVAMKYQISDTMWLGSEKFPVVDMKWIAGQYYRQICNYADIPTSQEEFNRVFGVSSNLWNFPKKDNVFVVVEDEFQNLFEMTRVFASRAKQQGFINVISENYYLRDYMIDNVNIFTADPKAIPTIVPDFARTERNMVLKLIMMMANEPVSEKRIAKELMLCGITFEDPYQTLKELICKHCNVEDATLSVRFKEEITEDSLHSVVVKHYEINETNALHEYAHILKNAYYIAEDEEGEKYYIGAKLYGHVFQALLPGQFMTFNGKYYEIQTVTPMNGVVVRRAADHITDRRYYRQLRNVTLTGWEDGKEMGSIKTVHDLQITRGFADILVKTDGYYEMSTYGDMAKAKKVTINGIPDRIYRNKSVLRIKLPGASDQVRYTICLILNEIFRTVYPEGYPYISALTRKPAEGTSTNEDVMYGFDGELEDGCIYIIEDSEIDLGLIVSVERNLKRFFEIVTETLSWHLEKMAEPAPEEEEQQETFTPQFQEPEVPQKKKGFFGRIFEKIGNFFKKLFKRKPKKGEEEQPTEETPAEGTEAPVEGAETPAEGVEAAAEGADAPIEGEEAPAQEETPKKKGIFARIGEFFKKLFKRKPKKGEEEQPTEDAEPAEEAPAEQPASETEEAPAQQDEAPPETQKAEEEPAVSQNKAVKPVVLRDETETEAELDIQGEDEELVQPETRLTHYQKTCFLKYGYEEFSQWLDAEGTISYLSGYGFDKGALQQVRSGAKLAEEYAKTYDPKKQGVHLCDFCGVELIGGEYELLKDGRERCNRCSMTAVRTADDFKEIFKNVMRNMETFYGIKLNVAIKVRMTDAKKIAKHFGEKFVATPGFDGRTLGFAQRDKTGYSIYIENGSPKLAAMATIAHELTHIWQYLNWNDKELTKKYGKQHMLEIYEGMAKWAEIQYLILMNEIPYAKRQEITTMLRQDAYGRGFLLYCSKYPITYGTSVTKTPFKENPPL